MNIQKSVVEVELGETRPYPDIPDEEKKKREMIQSQLNLEPV